MRDPRNKQAAEALGAMAPGLSELPQPAAPFDPAGEGETLADGSPVQHSVLGRARFGVPTARDRSIHSKRTLIPILLTLGLMLPAVATLKWIMPPDSPFTALPPAAVVSLIGLGAVLLLLGVMNMLHVRHLLRLTQPRRRP